MIEGRCGMQLAGRALPNSLVHLPTCLVHLPISLVHLPNSPVHLPISLVHLPMSLVHLPISLVHLPISPVHLPTSLARSAWLCLSCSQIFLRQSGAPQPFALSAIIVLHHMLMIASGCMKGCSIQSLFIEACVVLP